MAKKKKKKSQNSSKKNTQPRFLLLVAFLCIPLFIFLGILSFRAVPPKQMTTIPPDIKKMLSKPSDSKQILQTVRIPILIYHYVEYVKDKNDTIRKSLNIQPYTLEKQIQTLQNDGYSFISPSELANMIKGKREVPKKVVILSFDDGYRDFYTDVFPIVKKYNVKVVAYIVPGFIDKPNYLLSSQLLEISKNPLVEIGAHTVDHAWLKGINIDRAKFEINESKKMLEKTLTIPIVSFAYPYGAFDSQAVELVKKAGFTNAVSTVPGIEASEENRFFIFRIRPGGRTGKELLDYLKQNSFRAY